MSPIQSNSDFDHSYHVLNNYLLMFQIIILYSILYFATLTVDQNPGRKTTQHHTKYLEFMLLAHTTSCIR